MKASTHVAGMEVCTTATHRSDLRCPTKRDFYNISAKDKLRHMSIELKANEARRRQQNRRKDIEKILFVRSFHLFSSRDVSPFRYTNDSLLGCRGRRLVEAP